MTGPSNSRGWRHRSVAAALAAALAASGAVGLNPGPASAAAPPPVSTAAFCANVAAGSSGFTDVTDNRDNIECLVAADVTRGTGGGTTYTPGAAVTRGAMASFLVRLADTAVDLQSSAGAVTPLADFDGPSRFRDVPAGSPHLYAINRLAIAGIAQGKGDGTFGHDDIVSRAQMASFINRLQYVLSGARAPFTATEDYFSDDQTSPHQANINGVARFGIASGVTATSFDPNGAVNRSQMASFLVRYLAVLHGSGVIGAIPAPAAPSLRFQLNPSTPLTIVHAGDRTFTASGLVAGRPHDIQLFSCDNVAEVGGKAVFVADAVVKDRASRGETGGAAISAVNGISSANGDGILASGGEISFTVSFDATTCVVPVVFEDPSDDDTLNIATTDRTPTERYGAGGPTQAVPPESASNTEVEGLATLVRDLELVVVDDLQTMYFNTGDDYRVWDNNNGVFERVGSAEFFDRLTEGDFVFTCTGDQGSPATYDRESPNEICVVDVAPHAPTALTATAGTPATTSIRLDWLRSVTPTTTGYAVWASDEPCVNTTTGDFTRLATVPSPAPNVQAVNYIATGLKSGTTYCFTVTSLEGPDSSPLIVGTAVGGDDGTVERPTPIN